MAFVQQRRMKMFSNDQLVLLTDAGLMLAQLFRALASESGF
jgi:hypothetical protein